MKRKEFKLLIENWRKNFIAESSEVHDDLDSGFGAFDDNSYFGVEDDVSYNLDRERIVNKIDSEELPDEERLEQQASADDDLQGVSSHLEDEETMPDDLEDENFSSLSVDDDEMANAEDISHIEDINLFNIDDF